MTVTTKKLGQIMSALLGNRQPWSLVRLGQTGQTVWKQQKTIKTGQVLALDADSPALSLGLGQVRKGQTI